MILVYALVNSFFAFGGWGDMQKGGRGDLERNFKNNIENGFFMAGS
jgi:hypothetical protein